MIETLSVIFDGEVFRPETPVNLTPNTRYEITLQIEAPQNQSNNNVSLLHQHYSLVDKKAVEDYLSHSPVLPDFYSTLKK